MDTAASELQSVDEYAKINEVSVDYVIRMIKNGHRSGKIIENQWFIKVTSEETRDLQDDLYSATNTSTALLQSSAILNNHLISNLIEERNQYPLKANAPELGVDIPLITKTASRWKSRLLVRDLLMSAVALLTWSWIDIIADDEYRYYDYPEKFASDIGILCIALTGLAAMRFTYSIWQKIDIRRALNPERILENATPIECMPKDNVIVSGGFVPFVGSGTEVNSWSFPVNLIAPASQGTATEAVTSAELYSETAMSLKALGINDLQTCDQIFVDGKDLSHLSSIQPDGPLSRPKQKLNTADMSLFVGLNHTKIRHYKVVRIYLWGGQIVLSCYLRYLIQSNVLYTEAKVYVLPPLDEKHSEACNPDHFFTARDIAGEVMTNIILSPFAWIASVLRISGALTRIFHQTFEIDSLKPDAH